MSRNYPEPASPSPDDDARVITIGWQVIVLPVVLVLVLGGGFLVGRQIAGRGAAGGGGTIAGGAPIATLAAGPVSDRPVLTFATEDPTARYDPNTVYELPRRAHPLLEQAAPDFTMKLLATGEEVKLGDYAGKPVLLDFWATWCSPCRFEMPWFETLAQKHAEDGLVVLGFNVGEKVPPSMATQVIQQFVDGMGLTFPILIGEESLAVQRTYSVMGYPTLFLIDASGTVVDFHQGMFPNQVTLESRLQAILPEGQAGAAAAGTGSGTPPTPPRP
jgi:thiol-disulfide isomerase/thioredoxin